MTAEEPARAVRWERTNGTIGLGTWFGIGVAAHRSVVGTTIFCTDLVGSVVLPTAKTSQDEVWTWITAAGTALAVQGSVLLHELAHAETARRLCVRVDRITLWPLGGATELTDEPSTPRDEALITAAGPGANLAIGVLCEASSMLIENPLLRAATGWVGMVNLIIAAFDLLPGAQLDGGRILRAMMWARGGDRHAAVHRTVRAGQSTGNALLAGGLPRHAGATRGMPR